MTTTVSVTALSISGLQAYKRRGLDPAYLGLFALSSLYFAIGILLTALNTIRGLIILLGMLLIVRAWNNWKHNRTDEDLFEKFVTTCADRPVIGGIPGQFQTASTENATMKRELGGLLRRQTTDMGSEGM